MNVRPSHFYLLNISFFLMFLTFLSLEIPKGELKKNEEDAIFEKKMADVFQN